MMSLENKIISLLMMLDKHQLIEDTLTGVVFPDEPQIYNYGIHLKSTKEYSDGIPFPPRAYGFSFTNKQFAMLKALVEAVERFSNGVYKKKWLKGIDAYKNLKLPAVNPSLFTDDPKTVDDVFGWTNAIDVLTNKKILLPAQAAFITYPHKKDERRLTESITTGSAGGTDHETTLLRGMYEIVERDSFMTIYLNSISAPRVSIDDLPYPEIHDIQKRYERYNLEVYLFDITNDLAIPTFLAALTDRTGIGPSISFGLKTSLDHKDAIIGALEEASLARPSVRYHFSDIGATPKPLAAQDIWTLMDRGLYWYHPSMLKHLDFLLKQKPLPMTYPTFRKSSKQALETLLTMFRQKNIATYYRDITHPFLKDTPFLIYRVIMPQLQPLFLHERHREIRKKRLQEAATYFGKKKVSINMVPHPFL